MAANDTLARLREAALKSAASTASAPAPVPASAPAAAQPAPTPPAASQAAPAASQASPTTTNAVVTSQAASQASQAPAVSKGPYVPPDLAFSSDAEALAMIKLLHGPSDATERATTVSELYDETNANVGVSFSHPFAQVSKGNFKTLAKHCPKEFLEFMPDGSRAYNMVYLGYRVGATSWVGKFGEGKPPAFKFAIPNLKMNPDATEMVRQLLAISTKIQFNKVHESKYMHLGKLTPEIHIFGWKLTTGFIVLSTSGHKAVEMTTEKLDEVVENKLVIEPMKVISFTPIEHQDINNKKPIDDPRRIIRAYPIIASVKPTAEVTPGSETAALAQQWSDFFMPNVRAVAKQVSAFHNTDDFKGLSLAEIKGKLAQYAAAMV